MPAKNPCKFDTKGSYFALFGYRITLYKNKLPKIIQTIPIIISLLAIYKTNSLCFSSSKSTKFPSSHPPPKNLPIYNSVPKTHLSPNPARAGL